jgi:hypothetical protein
MTYLRNFRVEGRGQADFVGVSIINHNTKFCIAPTGYNTKTATKAVHF